MDVILYSLLKNKIANTNDEQITSVGDYGIEIVDSIPTTREANTIYFVRREAKSDDKLILGGKGLQCIVYNDIMLGMGVLNGNVFFDGYDFLNNVERRHCIMTDGTTSLSVENTKNVDIKNMSMIGRTVIENDVLKKCSVKNLVVGEQKISIEKELYSIATNAKQDEILFNEKKYIKRVSRIVLDTNCKWRDVYTVSDYTLFRITSFTSKPEFLTSAGLFNSAEFEIPTEENTIIDHGLGIGNLLLGSCMYVQNSVLYLKLENNIVGTTVTELNNYLTENPISVILTYNTEKVIDIDLPDVVLAQNGTTTITLETDEGNTVPTFEADLPISLD